jgi:hypothetical protein
MKRIVGGRRVGEWQGVRDGDSGFGTVGGAVGHGRCSSTEVEGTSVGSAGCGGWE